MQYYNMPEVGATQGTADSPTKFLCHIDTLLCYLTTEGHMYSMVVDLPDGWMDITIDLAEPTAVLVVDGVVVAAAFVDDLILLSGSCEGLQVLLTLVQDFYGFIGGEVVPHKSYWFTTASDRTLGKLDMSLSVLATHRDTEDVGSQLARQDAVVESMHSWCSELGLELLVYSEGTDVPVPMGATMHVQLHFPNPTYTLRSKSYTQFVQSLLSHPPVLDEAQLQFRLSTVPPHLLCYRHAAPSHMLRYEDSAPLALTPLGLTESTAVPQLLCGCQWQLR